jgi:hypothetical protein
MEQGGGDAVSRRGRLAPVMSTMEQIALPPVVGSGDAPKACLTGMRSRRLSTRDHVVRVDPQSEAAGRLVAYGKGGGRESVSATM